MPADLLPGDESDDDDGEPSECSGGTSNDESDGHPSDKSEPEVASGSDGKSTSAKDTILAKLKRPPCRQAGRYLARCPNCRVAMQVTHLKYRHVCNRSIDPKFRALEMYGTALERFKARFERSCNPKGQAPDTDWIF